MHPCTIPEGMPCQAGDNVGRQYSPVPRVQGLGFRVQFRSLEGVGPYRFNRLKRAHTETYTRLLHVSVVVAIVNMSAAVVSML